MAEGQDEGLVASLRRLIAGEEKGDDLPRLRQAVADGRITLASVDGSLAAGYNLTGSTLHTGEGQAVSQSGGVNFGQSNQIHIAGSVIGSMTLSLPSAAEAIRLLDSLQPFQPEQPPPLDTLPEPGPLPPGSRLPFPRNAVFTGREDDLKSLAKSLLGKAQAEAGVTRSAISFTRCVAATGTGGVGKTQLAVEFCYRYGRFFHGAYWLHADQDMRAEIAACGVAMGLYPWPKALPEQVQVTLQAWGRDGIRLVVLDNVDDVGVVQEWLPKLLGARVLITSRQRDWPPDLGVGILPLDSLHRPQSRLLLQRLAARLEKAPEIDLDEIAERLGDLPLALDLAGRYLHDRRGLSIPGFLNELEQAGSALAHSALQDWTRHNPTHHETNLAATFTLSWNKLAGAGEPEACTAQHLLCAAGYCAANIPIPWEVFYHLVKAEDGQAQAEVDKALGALEDGGLMGLVEAGALIHPLLAEFARLQDGAREESVLPGLAEALKALADLAIQKGLPEQFKPLRAHVETTAGWAEQRGEEHASSLWGNFGYHLWQMAEFTGSKAAFEKSLRIEEAAFGPDHPQVAGAASNLGLALRALGDYSGAQALYERALGIYDATFGPDNPEISTVLNNLGMVLRALGDYAGAKTAFERALRIDEAALGPDHPNVAIRAANLGAALHGLGDYTEAKAAFERALRIDTATFGPNHPNVARNINNLGSVLRALGDYEGAKAAFEQALHIDEAAFGPEHPNVAFRVSNLGVMLRILDDTAGAQAALERALAIDEAAYGPDHPDVARDLNYLGEVLQARRDYTGAKATFERALAIDEDAYGPDHPDVARDVNNLGEALNALGDYAGAKTAIERALAIDEAALGPEHPNVARDINNLGLVLQALGDKAGAEAAFEKALHIDERAFGPDHPNVARDVNNLGKVQKDRGDTAGAKAAFERALGIYEKSLPWDHPNIHLVRGNLESLRLAVYRGE